MNIRDFDLSGDRAAGVAFVLGSQLYEHAFEPDRRIDDKVAEEYFAELIDRASRLQGRIFIAEEGGQAIGWAVFVVDQNPLFVVEAERTYGYIAELFVAESARGLGVGRALIAACEDQARTLGLGNVKIGVLATNARAFEIYQRAGYAPYHVDLRKYL